MNSSISFGAFALAASRRRGTPPIAAGGFPFCTIAMNFPIPTRMPNTMMTTSLISSASLAASSGATDAHPVLLVFLPVAVMPALAIDERMSVSAWMLRSL